MTSYPRVRVTTTDTTYTGQVLAFHTVVTGEDRDSEESYAIILTENKTIARENIVSLTVIGSTDV